MTLEQIIAGGGSAGLILALAYAVRELWLAHKKEDAAREARLEATEAREDKLAEAVKESNVAQREANVLIKDLATDIKSLRAPYDGQDRRTGR